MKPRLSSKEKSRILKLSASGMPATRVAAEIKRNRQTVQKFLDTPDAKEQLADMYERLTRQTLESVKPEDIEKANLLQKVTSAAIMTDKMRLLRDQPTQIHVAYLLDAVQAIKEMRAAENLRPQLPSSAPAVQSVIEVHPTNEKELTT